jgi:O-antigen/teichoic acid export membrane protein
MWPVPLLNLGMLAAQAGWTAAIMGPQVRVEDLFAINLWTSVGQLGAAWLVYQARFSPGTLAPVELPPLSTLLRRAWPFALAAVFATAQTRLSVILLEHFFTAADAGYFSAANRFTEALRLLPNALFGALFPTLAVLALYPTLLQKTFKRIFAGLALFSMLVGLFCTLAAPMLIPLVYGPEFSPAIPVLSLLSWALGVSLLRGARTLYLYALGQEHRVNLLNGLSLLIHAVIGIMLVSSWGANGAALALFIGEAIALALLFLPQRKTA